MWRFTSKPVMFFIVDARCLAPMVLWFVHMRLWTFEIGAASVLIFSIISWFGLSLPVALRLLRAWWCGPIRTHIPPHKKRSLS
ncbi:IcmT/TraK family protein [Neokomagataea thailandica]|uniref:IcmT/TraK family protein n=1 Tax=Neokomagataea TaxID=1223423 RepID=UPI000836600C|nr:MULTISPECIES: IcmT/TraK family protein [Neokomagataea]